jgi:hypothetical protein
VKVKNGRTRTVGGVRNKELATLGNYIGNAIVQAQQGSARGQAVAFKEASITLGTSSIYGRNSIFDPCSPGDIFGLQVQTVGLMNWLGWRPNKFYRRRVDFIPWYGPQGTVGGSPTSGAGAPCADPNGWEYAVCGYELTHTSWYHRAGEGLDPHTTVQERCETAPRYRLNGVQIMDDVEWQMNGIMNVMKQDIQRGQIHGSHNNANEMDGLESLVRTTYLNDNGEACPQIGASIIDWAHDNLDGEVNNLGNIFDYLDELVTEIEWRASAIGPIAEADMILLTSRFMATKLLDAYSCYTICGVTDATNISDQALRAQARESRRSLNAGPLYDGTTAVGYIQLKSGRRLPIIVDDAMDISKNAATTWCTDIYLLTRRIGSMDVLYGEYLDLSLYQSRIQKAMPGFSVRVEQGGRFAMKGKEGNWCVKFQMGTSPEIYLSAPWAQARIQDVCVTRMRQPLTGDPFQPEYMPGGAPLHLAAPDV